MLTHFSFFFLPPFPRLLELFFSRQLLECFHSVSCTLRHITLCLHTLLFDVSLITWTTGAVTSNLSDWENMQWFNTTLLLLCPNTMVAPLVYETLRVSMVLLCAVTQRWILLPPQMQQSECFTLTLWLVVDFSCFIPLYLQ